MGPNEISGSIRGEAKDQLSQYDVEIVSRPKKIPSPAEVIAEAESLTNEFA